MKKNPTLFVIACSVVLIFVGACSKGGDVTGGGGNYESTVASYCRAIQSGDNAASLPLTVVGARALKEADAGPELDRAARRAEILQLQRVDIDRYYRPILPPSAQWKILEVGPSQVKGTKLVFIEIFYPNRSDADFTSELDPRTLNQVRHHIKKGVYYATVEEKSKLIVDLPNFRALSHYKTIESWD